MIGFDPSPPVAAEVSVLPGLGSSFLGLFEDPKEAVPFGIVAFGYSDANGDVAFDVEPGSYQLVVSRGTEYSVHQAPLTIDGGGHDLRERRSSRACSTPPASCPRTSTCTASARRTRAWRTAPAFRSSRARASRTSS